MSAQCGARSGVAVCTRPFGHDGPHSGLHGEHWSSSTVPPSVADWHVAGWAIVAGNPSDGWRFVLSCPTVMDAAARLAELQDEWDDPDDRLALAGMLVVPREVEAAAVGYFGTVSR
jgi:hypothetical protein